MAKATRDSNYWQGRLEREHPAIAERLRSGEIPSVRAAAIEAGLIRERTPLADLRRAWARAVPDQRQAFLAEVGLAGPPVVDHDRLAKMSRDELSAELNRVRVKNEPMCHAWEVEREAVLAEIGRRDSEEFAQYLAKEHARDRQAIKMVRSRMVERKMKPRTAAKQIGIHEDQLASLMDAGAFPRQMPLCDSRPIREKLLAWLG